MASFQDKVFYLPSRKPTIFQLLVCLVCSFFQGLQILHYHRFLEGYRIWIVYSINIFTHCLSIFSNVRMCPPFLSYFSFCPEIWIFCNPSICAFSLWIYPSLSISYRICHNLDIWIFLFLDLLTIIAIFYLWICRDCGWAILIFLCDSFSPCLSFCALSINDDPYLFSFCVSGIESGHVFSFFIFDWTHYLYELDPYLLYNIILVNTRIIFLLRIKYSIKTHQQVMDWLQVSFCW